MGRGESCNLCKRWDGTKEKNQIGKEVQEFKEEVCLVRPPLFSSLSLSPSSALSLSHPLSLPLFSSLSLSHPLFSSLSVSPSLQLSLCLTLSLSPSLDSLSLSPSLDSLSLSLWPFPPLTNTLSFYLALYPSFSLSLFHSQIHKTLAVSHTLSLFQTHTLTHTHTHTHTYTRHPRPSLWTHTCLISHS